MSFTGQFPVSSPNGKATPGKREMEGDNTSLEKSPESAKKHKRSLVRKIYSFLILYVNQTNLSTLWSHLVSYRRALLDVLM